MLTTLDEALVEEPGRKCFRLVGGILVERTVKEVVPAVKTNRDNVRPSLDRTYSVFTLLTDSQSDLESGGAVQEQGGGTRVV